MNVILMGADLDGTTFTLRTSYQATVVLTPFYEYFNISILRLVTL